MGIKILAQDEIKQNASSFHTPALLFANPKNLYQRRTERFYQLAKDHPLSDYLNFAGRIAEAQLKTLQSNPIPKNIHLDFSNLSYQPLSAQKLKRNSHWLAILRAILNKMKNENNPNVQNAIDNLEKKSDQQLETLADKLLQQDFDSVPSDQALFIWAALSLYWLQLTTLIPHQSHKESGSNLHLCPVCGSPPIASVVHFGSEQGLRYLHCSLCETEWHQVRSKCTNCDDAGKLDYWCLDEKMTAVKAETCGNCESYLKILYQEKDPKVEPAADDLAYLFLDSEMEEKGFAKSGLNPYLFP
ncbi:formate dehydrogenase accessory protein FdhE [[Haemophilus] felis]|nr:formate dehydrogenase accessory protein FdhE [[Haemophilus] felis]